MSIPFGAGEGRLISYRRSHILDRATHIVSECQPSGCVPVYLSICITPLFPKGTWQNQTKIATHNLSFEFIQRSLWYHEKGECSSSTLALRHPVTHPCHPRIDLLTLILMCGGRKGFSRNFAVRKIWIGIRTVEMPFSVIAKWS